jgi:hypothetical protein
MGNKKTAVEWFIRELEKQGVRYFRLSEKALKMEKKQRIQDMSKMQIISDVDFDGDVTFMFNPEQYYEQTYGGNK